MQIESEIKRQKNAQTQNGGRADEFCDIYKEFDMKYILILIKKQEKNRASIVEIEKLINLYKQFDFDFYLYREILIRTDYRIDESVKLV